MPGWLATAGGYIRIDGTPGPARDPDTYLQQLMSIHPVGDPDLCARRISDATAGAAGCGISANGRGAGESAATAENITRLGTQVMPRVRS